MRARATIDIYWELGEPSDYPSEVKSWEEAVDYDWERIDVSAENENGIDLTISYEKWTYEGDDDFDRVDDPDDLDFPERPYIPPPSPFYGADDFGYPGGPRDYEVGSPDLDGSGHVRK